MKIVVYSTDWCGDCHRAKAVLKASGLPYQEIDVEATETGRAEMMAINGGINKVPTIIIDGNTLLIEPEDEELSVALGLLN